MQLWPAVLASPALESSIKQTVILSSSRVMAAPRRALFAWLLLAALMAEPTMAQERFSSPLPAKGTAVLWRDPGDIRTKDLFSGPGGEEHRPELPLKFVKEEKHGHNSKFDAED